MPMYNKKNKDFRVRALSLFLCAAMTISLLFSMFAFSASAAGNKYEGLKLIPGGIPFGVKFNTAGVMVVGFCDVDASQGSSNPAYASGIRIKDIITKVNGKELTDANELTNIIENCDGKNVTLTYKRNGTEKTVTIKPAYSVSESRYKTGVWVRDSGAGIGTVTFINPKNNAFAGLGHGICDGETGELIPMQRGVVTDVTVNGIKKGVAGTPGEIKGYFGVAKKGTLLENTNCGVYGMFSEKPSGVGEAIFVGTRNEVKNGEAYIICTLDSGAACKYKIEISGINYDSKTSKCFTVSIKDPALIEKTGGIVQGMSGSPIIQNGKLIGAVTHVLINDPATGYGIFIENMLDNMPDLLK
mgnify:CR=1 FL=1